MFAKRRKRMMEDPVTRRNFLAATAGTAAGVSALVDPGLAAAQSVGVKKPDLPDLTVKQVKVYVTSAANLHRLNGSETGEIVAVVTSSGIEGNYSLGNRERTTGWLEWAKATLPGKSVLDLLPTLNATSGMKGRGGFDAHLRPGGSAARPVRRVEDTVQQHTAGGFVAFPTEAAGHGPITGLLPPTCVFGTFSGKRSASRSINYWAVPRTA